MTKTISALKARQNFGEIINRVYYGHETIFIARRSKKMTVILPISDYEKLKKQKIQSTIVVNQAKNVLREALTKLSKLNNG